VFSRAITFSNGARAESPRTDLDVQAAAEFSTPFFVPHPDSIMHALTRRDVRGPSDQIKLLIDSYYDRRTGYELAVNPDGVKRDFSMRNDVDVCTRSMGVRGSSAGGCPSTPCHAKLARLHSIAKFARLPSARDEPRAG
jgi:hypothetical protein